MRTHSLALLVVVAASVAGFLHVSPARASGTAVAVCATFSEETSTRTALVGTGLFATVDTLNCAASTPSLATLQGYAAVFAFPDNSYSSFPLVAQHLAQYVDGGGHLVLGQWGFESCCGTWWNTQLDTGGYLPVTNLGNPQSASPSGSGGSTVSVTSMAFDAPSSGLLSGVTAVGSHGISVAKVGLATGASQIAHWDDVAHTPAVAVKGNVVALNIWIEGTGAGASGDWLKLLTNALTYVAAPASTAPVERAGYCSVTGDVSPVSGLPIWPGTFLNLDAGQVATDPDYAGAVPANFVAGIGITCAPPPAGDAQQGFATDADNVEGGFYPYFAPPGA